MISSLILAQAEAAPNPLGSPLILIGLMFVMMYFLVIRPQSKQRKELAARIASMEKGDKVVTSGGIHATVHHLSDKTVTLKLAEGIFVPFEKTSIQTVAKVGKVGKGKPTDSDPKTVEAEVVTKK